MARPLSGPVGAWASRLAEQVWEWRRARYASGQRTQQTVAARVVSIGNLSVGGAGKTTLVLHLARRLQREGVRLGVVTRRYRPGPAGFGDEELLYREALGRECVFAGRSKLVLAQQAVAQGCELVLVDDGFSHWPLARDLDVVLLDRTDLWGGGRMLPGGLLREPIRALQRAGLVVVSRLGPTEDPTPFLDEVRRRAPAAALAVARHEPDGVSALTGEPVVGSGPARVLTATGNPEAVAASAREAGFGPVTLAAYPDHHWFRRSEVEREHAAAAGGLLLLTAKDAVRWPEGAPRDGVAVLRTRWRWVLGGEEAERLVCRGDA